MSDLVDGLFQLSFLLQDRLARLGAEHELSPIQVRLLGILRDRQPAMNKLARHLDLEKSSLSGLVDRAEKRGLVERVPSSEDRRAATIRLSTQGRKLARTLTERASADVIALCKPLSQAGAQAAERARRQHPRWGERARALGKAALRAAILGLLTSILASGTRGHARSSALRSRLAPRHVLDGLRRRSAHGR